MRPVEEEAGDGLEGLGSERDGDGLGCVGGVGDPLCGGSAINSREWELAGLVGVWRSYGKALRDVALKGGDIVDVAVSEGEGAVRGEVVCCGIVVAKLHGDGGICICRVGCGKRRGEAGKGGRCLIGDGGDGPTLPVEGTIAKMWYLRWKRGINVKNVFWCQA